MLDDLRHSGGLANGHNDDLKRWPVAKVREGERVGGRVERREGRREGGWVGRMEGGKEGREGRGRERREGGGREGGREDGKRGREGGRKRERGRGRVGGRKRGRKSAICRGRHHSDRCMSGFFLPGQWKGFPPASAGEALLEVSFTGCTGVSVLCMYMYSMCTYTVHVCVHIQYMYVFWEGVGGVCVRQLVGPIPHLGQLSLSL